MRWIRIRNAKIDPELRETFERYGVATMQALLSTQKNTGGAPMQWRVLRLTPAMVAGVSGRLGEIGDIVDVLEAWEAKK